MKISSKRIALLLLLVLIGAAEASAQESYAAIKAATKKGSGLNDVFAHKFIYMGQGNRTGLGSIIRVKKDKLFGIDYDTSGRPQVVEFIEDHSTDPLEASITMSNNSTSSLDASALITLPWFENLSAGLGAKLKRAQDATIKMKDYKIIRLQEAALLRAFSGFDDDEAEFPYIKAESKFPNPPLWNYYSILKSLALDDEVRSYMIVAIVEVGGMDVDVKYSSQNEVNLKADATFTDTLKQSVNGDAGWTQDGKLRVSIPDTSSVFAAVRELDVRAFKLKFID